MKKETRTEMINKTIPRGENDCSYRSRIADFAGQAYDFKFN